MTWKAKDKKIMKRNKILDRGGEWRDWGTCAAVTLFFNPFGSFLPPFPTFSVLIDKHWQGMRPRD